MNTLALLCRELATTSNVSQRKLADKLDISLGKINAIIKEAIELGYCKNDTSNYKLTAQGESYLEQYRVDNAIILAAGFGSRFVPFTYETPKGLLKVKGVPMIERQIEQLKERGIDEIVVVVGYLKEKFDYLIDKYGVSLVYNPEFAKKNNFVSLFYAREYLRRSYILMADNWIEENIFSTWEPLSWFSCLYFENETEEWGVTADNKGRITRIDIGGKDTWVVLGPAFFTAPFSQTFKTLLQAHYAKPGTENDYWEHILRENLDKLPIYMNKQSRNNLYEFESLEDLRLYDESYQRVTGNDIMRKIAQTFGVPESSITEITPLKDGVTNLSLMFSLDSRNYVFRKPGANTKKTIDRFREKATYDAIAELGLSDEIVHFDALSGIKIARYCENAHVVDITNPDELFEAIRLIRKVHESGIHTDFTFDIDKMIARYRSLADEIDAIRFSDFDEVAEKMRVLLMLKDCINIEPVLCHGDFAHTNVLICPDGSGRLIDWEHGGMGDPLMDIAMFGIDSLMDRKAIEHFCALYIGNTPSRDELQRIYLYVALGGFLWCIWAELNQKQGQEFGEYPMQMYRYAKDYYQIMIDENYIDASGPYDSLNEMLKACPLYAGLESTEVLGNITRVLNCEVNDLLRFVPLTDGMNNLTFRFVCKGDEYVYRHPGPMTIGLFNRAAETQAEHFAKEAGFDQSFLYEDPEQGWKLSRFITVTADFDYHNDEHVQMAMKLIKGLHTSKMVLPSHFDYLVETLKIKNLVSEQTLDKFPDFAELDERNERLYALTQADNITPCACHNDFFNPNLLVENETLHLIDWEWAGMADYASDLGTFICCSDYTVDEAEGIIRTYFEREPSIAELRHCFAFVSLAGFYWFVYALYRDGTDAKLDEYAFLWHSFAKEYGESALALYEK